MALTYRDIKLVKFPVYALPSGNWYGQDGLLFVDGQIVDDKNMSGGTLGIRRIQTPHKNLLVLKKKIDTLSGIVKNTSKCFIDTKGAPFIYEKTEFCKLKYYKIKEITGKDSCALLNLYNIKNKFVIPRPPPPEIQYAGVLHYEAKPWLLYDYSEIKLKDTRRKV